MSRNKLEKKLQSDPKFIPYNPNFDYEFITEYLKKIPVEKIDLNQSKKAINSIVFNGYYKKLQEFFSIAYERNKLKKILFIEIIISLANRDYYLISKRTQESYVKLDHLDYDKMTNCSFESSAPELGTINAQGGLEASHDGLNYILNLIKKEEKLHNGEILTEDHISNCFGLMKFSNLYAVIKAGYDMSIWENYSLSFVREDEILKINKPNDNIQELNKIGEYRLERNIFFTKQVIISSFQEKNQFYKYLNEEAQKRRKAKRLKKVKLKDNYLVYSLADGKEKEAILQEILGFSELTSYYSFISNETLPNFDNIKLYDIVLIFSEIRHLFDKASRLEKSEYDEPMENLNSYRLKIKKSDLTSYLFNKTNYSRSQIKEVLNLFCHNVGHYNLWEKPIIEDQGILYPILLPLIAPNTLRLLDYWLEKGGFDLDSRGDKFEEQIKSTLLYEIKRKGFQVSISDINNFEISNGEFEEIDLIVELKNKVIFGEVKCIKYPFDPRDFHNMKKRLIQATEQINRKVDFLKRHKKEFKGKINFSKDFVCVVITNYPNFSGANFNGVPITDFSLLENYFVNAGFNKGHIKYDGRKIEFNQGVSKIKYYSDEDSFSNNVEKFFLDPYPVKEKLDQLVKENQQITVANARPKIIMDYLKFKNPNII